jgi:hypothetical protein
MTVVKKEEKESKLTSFLVSALAANRRETVELCFIAQSAGSPVALAVTSAASELRRMGISVRMVVAKQDAAAPFPAAAVRHLADARCHDAHELLVLGNATAWIGDSMRRNPVATDSYELHIDDCAVSTVAIANSFERLWAIATPIETHHDACSLDLAAELAGLPGDTGSTITAMTRH